MKRKICISVRTEDWEVEEHFEIEFDDEPGKAEEIVSNIVALVEHHASDGGLVE
jgi:hypothetical protein